MSDPLERFEHAGCTVEIFYDDDPLNPRKDWDPATTMVLFHNRYDLPNESSAKRSYPSPYRTQDYPGWEEMERSIERSEDVAAILPVYMYDHSGVAFSTSPFYDPWDSGQVGFVYMTKDQARSTFMVRQVTKKVRVRALEVCRAEVKEYDSFSRGDCYGYVVTTPDGQEDSCFGYLGGLDDCIADAKLAAESLAEEVKRAQRVW